MSTAIETTTAGKPSLTRKIIYAAQYYLGGRRGLIVVTVVALGAGLVLNWSWLVAAGIAPLLLALAPCAAMCALGLCMNKMANKSGSTQSNSGDQGTNTNPSSAAASPKARDEV